MNRDDQSTLQAILNAGEKEFLNNGFHAASLRDIVKEAGVTTGAFYGYYASKEDLFHALVSEPAQILLDSFKESQDRFVALTREQQLRQMDKISGECMDWMVEYIYGHLDVFATRIFCREPVGPTAQTHRRQRRYDRNAAGA